MRRMAVIVVIIAMFGWVIYDFVLSDSSNEPAQTDDTVVAENIEEYSNGGQDKPSEEVGKQDDAIDHEGEGSLIDADGEVEIGLQRGNMAPDFELPTLDGDQVFLSDYFGKPIMLNFWASWCAPCRAEIPDMQKFYEDEDVEIVAVNLTTSEHSKDNVPEFVDEFGMTFPVLLDEQGTASLIYEIQPIPTTFLIDSEGIIHNVAYGPLNYDLMVKAFEEIK